MENKKEKVEPKLIAKKDWQIVQNEHNIKIKAGDDLKDVPKQFLQNLKTEGII